MQRLRTKSQFETVLREHLVARTRHFAMHAAMVSSLPQPLPGPADAPWMGTVVPKRWARRAVTRNLIRRQIYAEAQRVASELPIMAYVVRLRSAISKDDFPSASSTQLRQFVRSEIQQLFRQAATNHKA